MAGVIFEALHFEFIRLGLAAGLLAAIPLSVLGVLLVHRGQAMLAPSLANVAFAGVALAFFWGVDPTLMSFALVAIAASVVEWFRLEGHLVSDAGLAMLFSIGLALGVLVVSMSHGFRVDLFGHLFGSVLTVTQADVAVLAVVALLVVVLLALFYKELLFVLMDEQAARIVGLPVRTLGVGFILVTSIVLVLAAQIVGFLLVSALLVFPAVAAQRLAQDLKIALLIAAATGGLSVLMGMAGSLVLDVATGPTIATSSALVFLCATAAGSIRARALRRPDGVAATIGQDG